MKKKGEEERSTCLYCGMVVASLVLPYLLLKWAYI